MAGRTLEMRPSEAPQVAAPQVQEAQSAAAPQGVTERGAKFYRNLSIAQGGLWTALGVAATGPLAAFAFGAAAFNAAEVGISHKIAKNRERKRTSAGVAVAEAHSGSPESGQVARNRTWLESLKPWKPAPETLQTNGNETIVYDKGSSGGSRTRKFTGEAMVWGGGIYGLYNLVTLDIPGALVGAGVHVAGRWVRPKPAQ